MYNYCISNPNQSRGNAPNTKVAISGFNRSHAGHDGANIVGGELYNKLINYLKDYLKDICEVSYD